jgi:uncharacterized protein (TIGR03083 family)
LGVGVWELAFGSWEFGVDPRKISDVQPTDTRFLFRPVSSALVSLLRETAPEGFDRRTVAGTWTVRDVVAHLVDLTFRRLSFHRDRMPPPPPSIPINSERDFVRFINLLNAEWVNVSTRFSPRVLTDMLELASRDLADWFESLPADAPGLFGVSWAGEMESEGWFDVGREFTELWHHQEQIRMALGAPSLDDPRFLKAVIEIAVRGLPHAYREVPAADGETLVLEISGPSGGIYTLTRRGERWHLEAGEPLTATTRVRLSDQTAWMLLFNALSQEGMATAIRTEGQPHLAAPLLGARTIVI